MYLKKVLPRLRNDIEPDPIGIIHGYCYGDGTLKDTKQRLNGNYGYTCYFYNDYDCELEKYFSKFGRIYRRKAGNDKEYDCINFSYPKNFKEVPDINESESYLLGFLAGYFVADGNCADTRLSIYSHNELDLLKVRELAIKCGIASTCIGKSNIKAGQRGCLTVKSDRNGYTLRFIRNTIPETFFITSKQNKNAILNGRLQYKVVSVEQTNLIEDVYCCQTSTHSFTLDDFILTGNCFTCRRKLFIRTIN